MLGIAIPACVRVQSCKGAGPAQISGGWGGQVNGKMRASWGGEKAGEGGPINNLVWGRGGTGLTNIGEIQILVPIPVSLAQAL